MLTYLFDNLLALIALLVSCFALSISALTYYRTHTPFTILKPTISVKKGALYNGLTKDSFKFTNEKEFLIIDFRIINPLSSNVALFHIEAVATMTNHNFTFYKKMAMGLEDEDKVFFINSNEITERLSIPFSDYQNFSPSSFSYFHIVLNLDDVKKTGSSKITIFFRDTRFKFIKKCPRNVKGVVAMKHPYHIYEFDVSDYL